MTLNRRLVRGATFFVPLILFAVIPLFGIWSSRWFGLYAIAYVVTCGVLGLLKRKVDGTLWW